MIKLLLKASLFKLIRVSKPQAVKILALADLRRSDRIHTSLAWACFIGYALKKKKKKKYGQQKLGQG